MRKIPVRLLLSLAVAASLVPIASPARASTCQVRDPEVEYLVCDTVVTPTMQVVCTVLSKAKLPCFQ